MTDEACKKLIEDLLLMSDVKHYGPLYRRAADEIERLEQELEATVDSTEQRALKAEMRCLALEEEIEHLNRRLEQSDAEPVAQRAECVICRNAFQSDGGFICDKCRTGISNKPALAQSDAEPVAWQYLTNQNKWTDCSQEDYKTAGVKDRYRVLYTAPPPPDVSAGLIHDLIDDLGFAEWASPEDAEKILRKVIAKYHRRLCAADRSEK